MFTPYLNTLFIFIAILLAMILNSCSGSDQPSFNCTDPIDCVDIAPGAPIKIGVLQALNGSIAPLGEAQIRGLELALAKRGGKIHNHPVTLQIENTGCTSEGGANSALKLIADPQTVAIFGTTCSGAAASASQAMSAAGLTMVSGNNSAPFLTSLGGDAAPNWHPGYFRTASNEEYAGKVAAEYTYTILNMRKAATLHDNDIYTKGLTNSFTQAFVELGGEVVLKTAVNKGDKEMGPVLDAVAKSGAELLFFPLFQPEGRQLLLQAREHTLMKDILLMSDGALIQQSFLDATGETARGMHFVGPARPKGQRVDMLDMAYEDMFKERPTVTYYITGYDAADMLLEAIEQVAVPDAQGVLHVGRQALRERLYSTVDFDGVSGRLSCNKFGDCAKPAFNILRLDNPELGLEGLEDNIIYSGNAF